jgi:glycosyltransferase involved in cell wall biosynthesis/CheY-like chemotaxis protein
MSFPPGPLHRSPDPAKPALRVCFVSHSGTDGGAQRSLLELIEALAARGVESRVVVPGGGYFTDRLRAAGVRHVVCHYRPWTGQTPLPWWDRALKKPLVHLLRAAKLGRLIRRWRCDVVVTNTLTVCEGALAAAILRVPHITYIREYGDLDHGFHFELGPRWSVRLLGMLSERVAFNSAVLAKHYRRELPRTPTRVIYNAVAVPTDLPPAGPPAESLDPAVRLSCVLVGYLSAGKGHEDAIRAVADLAGRGMPVGLKLVGGTGPADYVARLRRLIDSLGVGTHVEMVGHVPEPRQFFLQADVALMCSRMEAFGRVTVEAMKHGIAVIGARSGGTSEVIRDGFNGYLYTPGDAHDLANKIEQLAQDREGARRMGERARWFATGTFGLERCGEEFLGLLREAIEARAPRRLVRAWVSALITRWAPMGRLRAWRHGSTGRRQTQVLVVDDDPLITQWLADSLTAEGHDVDVARDAWTALGCLEQGSYDLIVSDLRMPELDGVAFYRMLEREHPRAARRMLFLTGNTEVAEYRDFVAEKRDCTLVKPVALDELNRAARRILAIHGD